MLYRYIREKGAPSFAAMAGLADAAQVRMEWLATGEGSPDKGPQAPAKQGFAGAEIDLDLLESVATTTLQELETRRIHLEPAAQARLLRVLYRHFASKGEQPDHDTVSNIIDLAAYR